LLQTLRNQLKQTAVILRSFQGNTRTCLLVEPMWGVPFNLYAPYASLYMLELGASETQVGLITSLGLAFQMIFAMASGHITDRLGRKRTSLAFDLASWSIPTLIWAFAQDVRWFVIAAIINASVRVVHTSWTCLMIEDAPASQRVHIYSWLQVAGIIAGFVAPLAGVLVARMTLVPATRILYLLAFAMMTAMFFVRNHYTTETQVGQRKMRETPPFRLGEALADHRRVLASLVRSPYTLLAFVLFVINSVHLVIRRTFFSILLTEGLGFPKEAVALFPAIQSAVMVVVFVFAMPALARRTPAFALSTGLVTGIAGYLLLVLSPQASYAFAVVSAILTAYSSAVSVAIVESLLANAIEDAERAKIMAVLQVFLFAISTPFGALAGVLSEADEKLPFVLLVLLLVASLFVTVALGRTRPDPRERGL
jgi:MFS transporter, DHA1 family, tetracycline resistance protein